MALAVQKRSRVRDDVTKVYVRTTPAGEPGDGWHVHCLIIDANGFGVTSPGPDGHTHAVENGDVLKAAGHAHDLAARCEREHDRRVRHVE
jgi:hypothetical protein